MPYSPGDTLQMYLRLMIYHGKGSTKTISKPDTLTSDFKKFPSNLFDLWKCVQVHREWFQIYHILVRIINDFQFVNLMLPCSQELRRITNGWYQSPRFAPEAWLLYQNIATYDLHFTYFPLSQFLSHRLHFSLLTYECHTHFSKTPSKHQSSHSLCHCLANLLKLDIALLVPSSWHMHF